MSLWDVKALRHSHHRTMSAYNLSKIIKMSPSGLIAEKTFGSVSQRHLQNYALWKIQSAWNLGPSERTNFQIEILLYVHAQN